MDPENNVQPGENTAPNKAPRKRGRPYNKPLQANPPRVTNASKARQMYLSEKGATMDEIVKVTSDTQYEELTPDDLPIQLKPMGGGGTDFHPVFQYIEDNDVKPMCLVIFTDLYGSYPDSPPDYPVLWALEPNADPNDPKYGDVIRMTD